MKDYKDRKLCISISQFDLSTHQQSDTCSDLHVCVNINGSAGDSVLDIEVMTLNCFSCFKDKC